MSPALSVSIAYELHPPVGTNALPSMQTTKTHDFPLRSGPNSDQQEIYKCLREAVLEGKAQVGAELTEWRDAVGTLENTKEPKKGRKSEEEEEEEEEEEGQEQ